MDWKEFFSVMLISLVAVLSVDSAESRSSRPRVIGRPAVGDVSTSLIARLSNNQSVGYFTFIAGYDGPLFASDTVQDETTAFGMAGSTKPWGEESSSTPPPDLSPTPSEKPTSFFSLEEIKLS